MITFDTRLSKAQWVELTGQFCRKERDIQDLYDALFLHSRNPKEVKQQYAGYVLLHVHRTCPSLLSPKLPELVNLLDADDNHSSIPRQVFSVLQDRPLPEALAGEVFAKAVDHFLDMKQAIAVRARALECCENVASQYDGLWPEVYELANSIQPQDSAGMRSIGGRILRRALKELEKGA